MALAACSGHGPLHHSPHARPRSPTQHAGQRPSPGPGPRCIMPGTPYGLPRQLAGPVLPRLPGSCSCPDHYGECVVSSLSVSWGEVA